MGPSALVVAPRHRPSTWSPGISDSDPRNSGLTLQMGNGVMGTQIPRVVGGGTGRSAGGSKGLVAIATAVRVKSGHLSLSLEREERKVS